MALVKMLTDGDDPTSTVEFEVDEDGLELLGGSRTAEAPHVLAASLDRALPALTMIMSTLRAAAAGSDEITAELGLSIGGETGVVFVKGTAVATVKVAVTWRRPRPEPRPADGEGDGGG